MKIFVIIFCLLIFTTPAIANANLDSDNDGVSDEDEIKIYRTDQFKADTDGDGYNDWQELNNGFSPHNFRQVKLEDNDTDGDGLSDRMELNFHTNLNNPDTDGDGYKDGEEIKNRFDPLKGDKVKLDKKIEINTKKQELSYYLGGVKLGEFSVSSGKNNSTPKGTYKVLNKITKAWSPYGLWMPYWIGLGTGKFGIHELPIWPSGYREGENHLGHPVSHGCIRLGIGPAKLIYDWAEKGMSVKIY
ncbi:MAG: L,D-transpeptidase family protein [bacterium]|nr:L,D-transpeptidase family protein [bacterium]